MYRFSSPSWEEKLFDDMNMQFYPLKDSLYHYQSSLTAQYDLNSTEILITSF